MKKPQEILEFWFGTDPKNPLANKVKWWKKDPNFDRTIQENFEPTLIAAVEGKLKSWEDSEQSLLALVILLDQFSRNIYRNTPKAFSQDPMARKLCLQAISKQQDLAVPLVHRTFLYMPLMHSEAPEDQKLSLVKYKELVELAEAPIKESIIGNYQFAEKHAEIIFRFGRYPHRNEILGRSSSPEEKAFLKQPNSSF